MRTSNKRRWVGHSPFQVDETPAAAIATLDFEHIPEHLPTERITAHKHANALYLLATVLAIWVISNGIIHASTDFTATYVRL